MDATEILCSLLEERGVEWREHEAPAAECIAFFDGNGWHDCWESVGGEVNVTFSMTPEQAIAATLGSCNCSNSERTGTCHMVLREDIRGHAYQDIYECSECGEEVVRETCMGESEPPNFCPNCGKVVVSTTNDVDAEVDA